MIKLIFSDLDGTLLTKDKQILDKTKNAVLQSVKNGVAFSICTARAVDEAMLIFKVLGLKDAKNVYCCCFNGGVIYDVKNKKIIYQKTVNHKHAVEIFEEVKKFAKTKAKGKIGAHIHCISDKDVYKGKNKDVADFTSKPMPFYWWNKEFTYKMTGPEGENLYANNWPVKKDIEIDSVNDIQNITKFVLYFEDLKDRVNLYKILGAKKYDVELSSSHKNNGEVNPKGITKGAAVKKLCALSKIKLSETLCLGDNFNDLTMLEVCPNSVTLLTAPDEVKKVSTVVLDFGPSEFVGQAVDMFINNKVSKK